MRLTDSVPFVHQTHNLASFASEFCQTDLLPVLSAHRVVIKFCQPAAFLCSRACVRAQAELRPGPVCGLKSGSGQAGMWPSATWAPGFLSQMAH